jgi:hypothetical protein
MSSEMIVSPENRRAATDHFIFHHHGSSHLNEVLELLGILRTALCD